MPICAGGYLYISRGYVTRKIYTGHSDNVFAVAWSPDGRFIASGGRDRTVQVWQPDVQTHGWESEEQIWQQEGYILQPEGGASPPLRQGIPPVLVLKHPQYVLSLAWSPIVRFSSQPEDGTRQSEGGASPPLHTSDLASGSTDGLVHLWQVEPGSSKEQTVQPRLIRPGHVRFVRSLSWSGDGRFIASGGDYGDNTVQVWAANNGRLLFTHTAQYRIFATPWSPVASLIASGSFDSSVRLWSAFTGERVQEYRGHQGPVYAVAWSPDGTRVVSAGHDTRVIVWSAEDGKEILVYNGHKRAVKTLAWSPDGRFIASGGDDGTVQIWSTQNASVYAVYQHASWVRALCWSPDGTYLASATGKTVEVVGLVGEILTQ